MAFRGVIFLVLVGSYAAGAASRSDYQDYLTRNDDEEGSIQYPDDEGSDISSLQDEVYQETDVFDLRKKKAQTLCKVVKIQKQHHEEGYEFHPKSYNEYECVPYNDSRDHHNFDVCFVSGTKCHTLEKRLVFGKQLLDSQCLVTHEKTIKVGCNCINHVKFHFA